MSNASVLLAAPLRTAFGIVLAIGLYAGALGPFLAVFAKVAA
jgi:hypothetical protein